MHACFLDHLVLTAPSLASGADFVQRTLGVSPQPGGQHPKMGTHNLVLRLGDSIYLEVIAADPSAPKPGRPRWFELDKLKAHASPRLTTWVARTSDIRATVAACSESLGNIEPMSRGELNWLITISNDGRLVFDGVAPMLIEWHTESHPASQLQDSGCFLIKLEAFHPEAKRISALLDSISFEGPVSVSPLSTGKSPHLIAYIQTPQGIRQLGTSG